MICVPFKSIASTWQLEQHRISSSSHSQVTIYHPRRDYALNHCLLRITMRRPKLARDTLWLASSDGISIILGLIGQIILARALLQSEYGLLVVILDAFATMYILIDAGLPTILARDLPRHPGASRKAVHRVLKLQMLIAIPFIIASAVGSILIWDDAPVALLFACGFVAFGHIMSYPHKAMLRLLEKQELSRF